MPRRFTPENLTELADDEVFVFGSNASGFHAAGAAGLAFRGDAANTWREDPRFLAAMAAPPGDEARVGRWAVYGVARGLQRGREGESYAVETVRKPGLRRSTPLAEIAEQLDALLSLARSSPERTFLVTRIGCGLAGYTEREIRALFEAANARGSMPDNLVLPRELDPRPP